MNDRCLNKLDEAWEKTWEKEWFLMEEKPWTFRAKIIRSIIIYCRQRYGAVAKFKARLEPKIVLLEESIFEIPSDELCAVTSAIAYGRKQISDSGEQFATGFGRQPSGAELDAIQESIRGGTLRLEALNITDFAGPGRDDDFRSRGVDDDPAG